MSGKRMAARSSRSAPRRWRSQRSGPRARSGAALRLDPVTVLSGRLEPDAADVVEGYAQPPSADLTLQVRVAARGHARRLDARPLNVGERGAKVALRQSRLAAAAESTHPHEPEGQDGDGDWEPRAGVSHVLS